HQSSSFARRQQLDEQGLHLSYPKQRKVVDSSRWPWRAVGQINVGANRFCSGVLVGPDQVLTVAHCIWDKNAKRWHKPANIHFVAGYSRGNYQAYSRIKQVQASGGFHSSKEVDLSTVHRDWALLRLEKPIGGSIGFLPMISNPRQIAKGATLALAGYRQDRSEVLTVERDCKLLAHNQHQGVFDHSCKVREGDSGGPLLSKQGDTWQVMGIQSLEARSKNRVWGIALTANSQTMMP
ncbi:MAG: trypsin-like serine protease, partial [Cellvibrionaceae bacterium]|nr:trypsin-like serine protease [Cellvibrionaceae bacterium]